MQRLLERLKHPGQLLVPETSTLQLTAEMKSSYQTAVILLGFTIYLGVSALSPRLRRTWSFPYAPVIGLCIGAFFLAVAALTAPAAWATLGY